MSTKASVQVQTKDRSVVKNKKKSKKNLKREQSKMKSILIKIIVIQNFNELEQFRTLSATIKVFDILVLKKSTKHHFLFAAMAVNLVLLWDVCIINTGEKKVK